MRGDEQQPDFADLTARVYRLCLALLGSETESADATQEAMARAWSRRASKRSGVSWWVWMCGFAVRVCRETRRRSSRRSVVSIEGEEGSASLRNYDHADDERLAALQRAVMRLPDRQREVVVLRFMVGQSTREAADSLACPEGTIKSNLHKALSALHAALSCREMVDEL